jgi:hypothetical protein
VTISTRATLITAINAWGTFDQSDQVPDFVDWAHQEIARRLRSNLMLTRANVTITGGSEFAAQPADFAAIKTFRLDNTDRTNLTVTSPEIVEDMCFDSASQTHPEFVAVEGANFHFGPVFTATVTGKLLYYAIPATLTDDAETNAVLTKYPFTYLYAALEALYRFMEDDTQADRYGALFGALITDINAMEARDAMSGPLQVRNAIGRVV